MRIKEKVLPIKPFKNSDLQAGIKIKVRIQYFGSARVITKKEDEAIEAASGATVSDLLQELSCRYGESFKTELFQEDGESLRDDVAVAVNGAVTNRIDLLRAKIKPGDTIALLPVFLGGG